MRTRSKSVLCVVVLFLVATACGGGRAQGIRASATGLRATTTTAPPETTTSSPTTEATTTTTSTTLPPATSTTRPAPTTSTSKAPTTTAPAPTTPTTRFPGDTRRAIGWDRYVTSADGRSLTFTYFSGPPPCSIGDGVQVEETASTVRVTIFERDGSGGQPCIALAQQKSATVTLATPLLSRKVVDGARS